MRKRICLLVIFLDEVDRLEKCLSALDRAVERSVHQVDIVAIDSGSKDGSLRHFRKRSDLVFRLEGSANPSVGAALYRGFGLLDESYDYAQYVEVDSWFDDSWLDTAVAELDRAADDVVGVKGVWANGSTAFDSAAQRRRSRNTGAGIGGPALMSVAALREFPYNPHLPGYADIDHSLRLKAAGRSVLRLARPMFSSAEGQMGYAGLVRKVFRRYSIGAGMSLRHGWGDGRLRRLLLRRLWRQFAVLGGICVGLFVLGVGVTFRVVEIIFVVLILSVALALWVAAGGRSRAETIGLWLARAVGVVVGFLRRPAQFDAYESHLVQIPPEAR